MQMYADVLDRPIDVAASQNAPALGAAMFGAIAGGACASIREASEDGGTCHREVPTGQTEPARV